jgi:anaerobic magnesium-protoporphyrin IX monomethyl ester cyclase
MNITFVHTPMAAITVPERELFWRNFDIKYHAAHPGLRHMVNNLWELPHWMHWLGGVLVAEGFTQLRTLDFYTSVTALSGIDRQKVHETLLENEADVYLFSPMTPNIDFAYQIAEVIKALYPQSVVVFGGVMATPLHREVAEHSAVDYVVWDRGEFALPNLLKTLRDRGDITKVGNLTYKPSGEDVRTSPVRYPYPAVEKIPFPKIDLFPQSVGQDLRYLRVVHALGCPYKCPYCTIQTIGRKADCFPTERVLAEIRAYRAYYGEHHNIYFGDETFTVHPAHTIEFCAALEEEGGVYYDCQTRLNCLADINVIKALARSGCRWIEVGLETDNQESLNLYKQGMKLTPTEDVLTRLRDEGLAACSFMVNGFPNQTLDDMKRSTDWVCSLIERDLLQASYLQVLVPYPGSDMYEHPDKYGMTLRHHDYRYYNEDMAPVFDSAIAKSEDVYEQFKRGLTAIGQAMAKKPYFGNLPRPENSEKYGAFWSDSHI